MKIGVNLLNWGPGVSPDALARTTALIEALGYHLVMISDHVAPTPDVVAKYPTPLYDPFTTLGWLAAATRRVELGTTVIIIPYRSPLLTARMAATVDRLSGGRFIFGVGVGWAKQEFDALGVPFTRRGAISNEYLEAIKTLWTQDVASYHGTFVSFQDVHTAPRPIRSPHPPIWIGGSSDAALRRAVRYGDGWHPNRVRMDWLRDTGLPKLRAIAAAERKPVPALCPRIRLELTESPLPDAQRLAGQGTLDQMRKDLDALQSLGAAYVLLDSAGRRSTVDSRPGASLAHARDARRKSSRSAAADLALSDLPAPRRACGHARSTAGTSRACRPAVEAAPRARRRSSGTCRRAPSSRTTGRTCTRTSRSPRPASRPEDRGHSIRSLDEVAA
jgi:probable F420-dependent oxidoreductase